MKVYCELIKFINVSPTQIDDVIQDWINYYIIIPCFFNKNKSCTVINNKQIGVC